MAIRIGLLVMAALAVLTGEVTAQEPVRSFDQVSAVITPGKAIVVDLEDGRRINAKVVSLSNDRIEIHRRRWNFRSEQFSLPEGSILRIEQRDSTWNGTLLGFGAGALAAWAKCKTTQRYPHSLDCLPWIPIAPAVGAVIGTVIDANVRRPLYIASGSRVRLVTAAGSGVSVVAMVGF